MTVDLFTYTLMTALVVFICGIVFIVETLLRRDHGPGRVWSLAFLSGMLTTSSYLVWTFSPEPWIAIAIGNASLVASAGFLWLGCRAFNGRRQVVPGGMVAFLALLALVAVLIAGPDGGDWAGALVMFVGIAVLAGIGAIESRRGAMAAVPATISLTVVLGLESLFYLGRALALLAAGADSELFLTWFGSQMVGGLTVLLSIVTVVTLSSLRAGRLERDEHEGELSMAVDGVLRGPSFRKVLGDVAARAERRSELLAVVAYGIEDLDPIRTAFGRAEQEALIQEWREGVRRHAPTLCVVGESGSDAVLICFLARSVGEVRRTAGLIHRQLLGDFALGGSTVIPVLGVGVALSTVTGYDPQQLIAAARAAGKTSASSSDASVTIAGAAR